MWQYIDLRNYHDKIISIDNIAGPQTVVVQTISDFGWKMSNI